MSWDRQRMYRELLAEEIENEAAESGEDTSRVDAAGDIGALGFNVVKVNVEQ